MSDAPERIGLVEIFGNYALWNSNDHEPAEAVAQYIRTDLATRREADAYRAGLEAAAAKLDAMAAATPIGHENRKRGASTYNWLRAHAAAIRAMKDDTP